MMLMLVSVMSMGAIYAPDPTATFDGLDPTKSQNNQGIMNLTNNTDQSNINGLCAQPLPMEYISNGDIVTVTPGTDQIVANQKVKQLIANNYREDMTPQQGSDLQNAIWSLTSPGYQAVTPGAQAMLDAIDASVVIPDSGYKVQVGEVVTYDHTDTTIVTEETGSTSKSSDIITKIGELTTVTQEVTEDCIKTITTIVESFNKQTTIDTVTSFTTTTTITSYYNVVKEYLTFDFNSVISPITENAGKQDLILFTATPSVEESKITESETSVEQFTKESQEIINTPFDVTTVTSICDPVKEEVQNVTVNGETIPMEKTGAEMLPGILSILAVLSGLGLSRKLK